jgi:hypothetical protein
MPCALIAGYTIDCRDAVGGIDAVFFIEHASITAFGESSGTITAMTKASGKRFYKFEVPSRSTANASSNPVGSTENGTLFFEQTVTLPVNKRDATTRNVVTALAKNKVIAVTKDKDGTFRMYFKGYGGFLEGGTGQTGAAAGDANGYVLPFVGQEKEDFFVVSDAVAAALETPGS